MSRKLLLLTYYFPPVAASGAHRWLGISRHLPNHDWQTVVVAPTEVKGEPNDPALLNLVAPGTQVERAPFPNGFLLRQARRLLPYETWLAAGWRATREAIERYRPDVVLSTSPPGAIHTLGRLAQRQYGLPWIVDLRDPWYVKPINYRPPLLNHLLDRIGEKTAMRHADRILANTPTNLSVLQKAYPDQAHKMMLLTNGFDPAVVTSASVGKGRKHRELTLLHAGELYAGRDPRPLIRCMAELNRKAGSQGPRFRLKLLGSSDGNLPIIEEIRKLGLEDIVETPGQVPHSEVISAITEADILVCIQGPGLQTSVPAKLYEYMSFRKPILQLAPPGGDIDWVLKKSSIPHRVVSQSDESGIKQALSELTNELSSGTPVSVDFGTARVFTRAYLAEQLAKELDALALRKR